MITFQKAIRRIPFLAIVLLSFTPCLAQEKMDIVLKAMKDELERSMRDLAYEGYEKPFFISYGVNDVRYYNIVGSLGALYTSTENRSRDKAIRVLVGNYDFNDESLDDNLTSAPEVNDISLPLEDDYLGIRRAFWTSTDNVYKSAARHFAKHVETLKEQKKSLPEIPHRSFARVLPVNIIREGKSFMFDKKKWEGYAREISGQFNAYGELSSSAVVMVFREGHQYIVNSEGTVVKIPFSMTILQVSAQTRNEKGETIMDQFAHYAFTPDRLPTLEDVKGEARKMASRLVSIRESPVFRDDYAGPVLFIGPSVADLLVNSLIFTRESLMAGNNIPSLTGFRYDPNSLMENKIGRSLFSETMTVTSRPKLKTFNDTDLLGSFEVDDEGVEPANELTLIDKGVLQNLLNDRTLIRAEQAANGHSSGPGVIEVRIDGGASLNSLKEKLIELAKKEGLEYALLIREGDTGRMGFTNVYKVSIEDGGVELLRAARIEPVSQRNMRKVAGASTEMTAHNIQSGNGGMVSFIVPHGLLLESVIVNEAQMPLFREEEYVANPLKK